jgi:hypothetical protein
MEPYQKNLTQPTTAPSRPPTEMPGQSGQRCIIYGIALASLAVFREVEPVALTIPRGQPIAAL